MMLPTLTLQKAAPAPRCTILEVNSASRQMLTHAGRRRRHRERMP